MEFFGLLVIFAIGFVGGQLYERKQWQKSTGHLRAKDIK